MKKRSMFRGVIFPFVSVQCRKSAVLIRSSELRVMMSIFAGVYNTTAIRSAIILQQLYGTIEEIRLPLICANSVVMEKLKRCLHENGRTNITVPGISAGQGTFIKTRHLHQAAFIQEYG